jgi:hypothetical protein
VHNLQIPRITSFSQTRFYNTRMPFKHRSRYSPTSSQARVLVVQVSIAVYLQDLPSRFFSYYLRNARKQENYYRRATYKDNFSTCPQPRILFWFTSSGFLKRPVSLKYWLLCPFFYKEATCKSSTIKGLLYAAKEQCHQRTTLRT